MRANPNQQLDSIEAYSPHPQELIANPSAYIRDIKALLLR